MSQYCFAPETTVLDGPKPIPETWVDPRTKVQYSNFNSLSDAELLALGWKPYVENDPGSPGAYHDRQVAYVVSPTDVTGTITYSAWDIEAVRNQKDQELESQLTQYGANEVAANPKTKNYVEHELKWLAEQQVLLASLSDWNAVATFDSAKPAILVLPNSFVGQSNVDQGVALTAENNAAVDSGLSERWDQPTINAFVAANQAAADDPSDSTPPTDPDYRLRQGIAKPSECSNRLVVWRFDVEGEPNPSLQRSMAMRMRNRQDARKIYTFIYTNAGATYLGWKLFKDLGNAVWGWHLDKDDGDGSIMTWVDSDIALILSYSEEPSVQEDYFTDKIQFPNGVPSKNLFVAWDPV